MGRSLSKRFFGNRNLGSASTTADDGIGGNRVGSVTIDTVGSYTSALPTVTFSDPDLSVVGAVTATGTVHGKALSAAIGAAGSGYQVGDLLVQHNGATGTYAVWKVRSVVVVGYSIDTTGQVNFDGDERLALDSTINAKWTTAFVVDVQGATGDHKISSSTLQQAGIWNGGTGYTAAPTQVAITGGGNGYVTRGYGDTNGSGTIGQDNNGSGGFLNITYGIQSLDLVSEGDYTAITSGAKALDYSTGSGGSSATATITYGVKSIAIDEPGSGYTDATDAAVTFSGGTAAGTVVLETDATDANSQQVTYTDGSNENAIIVNANLNGSSGLGEIVAQKGARRYRVETSAGVGVCNLTTDVPPAQGYMTIYAYDSAGNTYTVTKLTRHLATVTQYSGSSFEFNNDDNIPWTFDDATLNTTVKINNR